MPGSPCRFSNLEPTQKMNKETMCEVLKELRKVRMENKEIIEKASRLTSEKERLLIEKVRGLEKTISEMQKEIKDLRWKKQRQFIESIRVKEEEYMIDPTESEGLKHLSSRGVECILQYMDPNKRLLVSLNDKHFRKLEKVVSLRLEKLELTRTRIVVNDTQYEFRDEEGKMKFSDPQYPMYNVRGKRHPCIYCYTIEAVVHKVFSTWFDERKNFVVGTFQASDNYNLKSRFNVETILVDFNNGREAFNGLGLVEKVDRILVISTSSIDRLMWKWCVDGKLVEMLDIERDTLMPILEHFRTERIYFYFYDIVECIQVIENWLKNEKREIGLKLFLVINQKNQDVTIKTIFNSKELSDLGFVASSPELHHKPMENNLEARLTVRQDKGHFSKEFLDNTSFSRYLCLQIVHS